MLTLRPPRPRKGRRPTLILRTQLSVRVHAIIGEPGWVAVAVGVASWCHEAARVLPAPQVGAAASQAGSALRAAGILGHPGKT